MFWRVTFSDNMLSLTDNGVDLGRELVRTSGTALCRRGDVICTLTVEIQDDEVTEAKFRGLFPKCDVCAQNNPPPPSPVL